MKISNQSYACIISTLTARRARLVDIIKDETNLTDFDAAWAKSEIEDLGTALEELNQ